jgi:CRP-like cAMP-binding protein
MNSLRLPGATSAAAPAPAAMTAPRAGERSGAAPVARQPPPAASLHSPGQNRLLAALPPEEFERVAPHLELVAMQLGEMLYEPGEQLKNAYFPTTAIASLHYVLESGASAESAGVGNEGVVGVSLFMGGDTTTSSAVVQTAGHAYCLPARLIRQEFERGGTMRHLMLRYTQALMTQMAQTAACNRHHALEQQLCRFLLLTLDRLPSRELVMTQELVASMLGVRREGITEAAGKLQSAGVISYRRGHITVLDRSGLERRSCECYAVVKKEMGRLLSDVRYHRGLPGAA